MPCQAASTILHLLLVALSIEEMGSCLQLTKSKRETSCAKRSDWIFNVFEINLDSSPNLLYALEPVCWNFVCLMFSSKGEYGFLPISEDLQTFTGFHD